MYTIQDIQRYTYRFLPEGLIVDTNILILFLMGSYDSELISQSKLITGNAIKYKLEDFQTLKNIFKLFKKIIITPHIITELSNLSITGNKSVFGKSHLKYTYSVIKFLENTVEHQKESSCLWGVNIEVIGRLGFTDLTLLELAKEKNMAIITDDFGFYNHGIYCKVPMIKFEHVINSAYTELLHK